MFDVGPTVLSEQGFKILQQIPVSIFVRYVGSSAIFSPSILNQTIPN